jgi:hypothetical protein
MHLFSAVSVALRPALVALRLAPVALRAACRAPVSLPTGVIALALASASCQRRTVQVYDVPKPAGAQSELMTAGLVPSASSAPVSWTKPAAWQEQPLSEMRQGSFRAAGPDGTSADISVVSFPGVAGGLESNLNRWRGQVDLPPMSAEELQRTAQPFSAGQIQGIIVDYASPPGSAKASRILGAVIQTADRSWFVKMTGPPAFVETQKEIFDGFVRSFHFPPAQVEGEQVPPSRSKSSNDQ